MGIITIPITRYVSQLRDSFKTRDFIFHDGRDLRRFSVGGNTQAALAGIACVTLCFSAYGVAQAGVSAVQMSGILASPQSPEARLAQLQARVIKMQAKVAAIKRAAEVHAARVDQRQALIAAALSGKSDPKLALTTPLIDAETAALAADIVAPFRRVEDRQLALAIKARQIVEQRYASAAGSVRQLGIAPERLAPAAGGVGGPYEPVNGNEPVAEANADAQFRSLFMTWKKLDTLQHAVISIPSAEPVAQVSFSSRFGVRSDPFRGTAAMHAGVDIPGAIGTPVYATADGIVSRAERSGGYGNLVEVNHGRGIATRYGHLSKILVAANTRVTRGQVIALMGSTGRSTGSHLHYEVRIDGQAVNPIPFLQASDYLLATQDRAIKTEAAAIGGSDSSN
ncbi:MAG: peptidase M23 [Sphingomonas sp. 28-66-16]|nr:MAG: peptidase M23 [Sphingomonas sp. 28-66-16]